MLFAIACKSGHPAAAPYKYSVNQVARRFAQERLYNLYSSTKLLNRLNLFWHFELKRPRQMNMVEF